MNVEHDIENSRFVIPLNGAEAELVYALIDDDAIDMQHTRVPASDRNRGVADALVRQAMTYARHQGLRIIPTCSYVRAWLRRHPEERLASGS
jgi:uncharacterized protein